MQKMRAKHLLYSKGMVMARKMVKLKNLESVMEKEKKIKTVKVSAILKEKVSCFYSPIVILMMRESFCHSVSLLPVLSRALHHKM